MPAAPQSQHAPLLPLTALTTFLVPAAAVLLLAGAVPVTVLTPAYEAGVTALAYGEPVTAGLAAVVAVVTARLGGRVHMTWLLALTGLLVATALLGFFGSSGYSGAVTVSSYLVLRSIIAVCAGIALGAAFSRAWSYESPVPAIAAVSGTGATLLLAEALARPASGLFPGAYLLGSTSGATLVTWSVLACAISAAIMAMILDAAPPPALARETISRARAGLAGTAGIVVILAALQIAGVDVLARAGLFWPPAARFAAGAAVIAILFLATWLAAMWLGLNDSPWSGALLLVATAVAAAALPVIPAVPRIGAWWVLLVVAIVFIAALALGVAVRHRGYHAVNGLLALAVVPVVGLIAGGTAIGVFVQLILVALGGGFALGVCLPGAGPAATLLGFGVIFTAHTYNALLGGAPSTGAVPVSLFTGSANEIPHSWWAVIPEGSGAILSVALVGLCGVGVLTCGYTAYRLARRGGGPPPKM
ncbi:hypothetical protein ONR57_00620 [Hoyosella sp. YIM 151337]|uniref:hypothetical protein n=1 Tax=Hoyosella sp. YIM 151337 TaxID=2992742 RepID=UPI00223608B7|nr:hypothetical protein [Hoyosella sp. YIM 151337]MCW4351801.1 hypothetical protein [Hoyosella sp. YIM 151337]